MICRDTVEEKLLTLQESKRKLTDEAFGNTSFGSTAAGGGGNGNTSNKLSLDELRSLFL